MAQNITLLNASYSDVPAVTLPKTGGGTAKFTDVTPTTATDADVASGKVYFKADGTQSTGTNAGGITPTGNINITTAGTTDVTNYATATVATASVALPSALASSGGASVSSNGTEITLNKSMTLQASVTTAGYISSIPSSTADVTLRATDANFLAENIKSGVTLFGKAGTYTGGGGGGMGDLLATVSIGAYSTSSTSATNMNKSIAATNIDGYDVLVVETSVDTEVANRHTATVGVAFITNSTNAATKNAAVMANAKWNAKLSSSSVTQTTSSTTAYGIYPNSCTVTTTSNGTATFAMYSRYNSSRSGTINGTYTSRIYGLKLCDLIGG